MSKYNMRYTILGLQQAKMIEYGLDLSDALLIDTLKGMYASPSFERIIEDNEAYIWVNQTFLLDYIPLVGSRATLQRKLNKLEDLGFLKRIVKHTKNGKKGNFSYIAFLPKVEELTEYDTINNPNNHSDDKDISVDNSNANSDLKVIHNECNDSKPHKIARNTTLSQNETRSSLRMTQGLSQNDTRVVSKRHNKDTLNKDSLSIDTQSIKEDRLNETKTKINSISELSNKYNSDILTIAMQKANKAKQAGTVINNLYAYLDKICQETMIEDEMLNKNENKTNQNYKKTKFHNFEQRTDKYTASELEEIARRKQIEYDKRIEERNKILRKELEEKEKNKIHRRY